jgi:predicted PhzF superfamily epimerase YddE/YHI9
MSEGTFHLVDVPAEAPYAGNQIAVFHDTASWSTGTVQALTREMNHSESAFIESTTPDDDRYDVRIFDPVEELAFAGHPTLGIVAQRYFDTPTVEVRVEQGHEIGRPSLIHLRASDDGSGIDVSVGGRVQPVAEGRLLRPRTAVSRPALGT